MIVVKHLVFVILHILIVFLLVNLFVIVIFVLVNLLSNFFKKEKKKGMTQTGVVFVSSFREYFKMASLKSCAEL